MIRAIALAGLCFVAVHAASAQMPFDMTPELHLRDTPAQPPVAEPVTPQTAVPSPVPGTALERHLLPRSGVRFEGEVGRRAFDFYLTADQAAAPASLDLSVLNSIVVAPEYSRLAVNLNGTQIVSVPISYAAGPSPIAFDVPDGMLVAGRNRIEIAADQRHRTDCSVTSTYELWTEIHGGGTMLALTGQGLGSIAGLDELPAIGLNANGATELRFLIPQLDSPQARTAALRLAQYVALAVRAPSVEITLIEGFDEMPSTGALTVVLATADALPQEVSEIGGQAGAGPVAGVVSPASLANTLVVSGPDWEAVDIAIRSLEGHLDRRDGDLGGMRVDLPDSMPLITGRANVPLSQLGVDTVEFNGRRFHTGLRFALPADFYADMYGEAQLILDAGYSAAVRPGSQLDIYVNGQIAAVAPILRLEGGTFRNSRLRVPMTNFRPGINEMYIETILLTGEDEICPPGLSGQASARFLFSAESQMAFPDFGRIAQYPDLSALAGAGAPYAGTGEVSFIVSPDTASIQSAMMLLARMALSSGGIIEANVVTGEALDPAANAMAIGPMASLPDTLLARGQVVGIDATGAVPVLGTGEDALERWREATGATSSNMFETARDWVAGQLGLAPENFWLFRRTDGAYRPQSPDAAILSQALQPEGGVWTVLTVPEAEALVASTSRLVAPENWQQVSGRVSAIGPADDSLLVLHAPQRTLVQTQAMSFTNLRLIAANWLSTNVLGYAVLLAVVAVLLTVSTSLLLGGGKRKK